MNTYNSKQIFRSSIIMMTFLITSMLIVLISCDSGGTSDPSPTEPAVNAIPITGTLAYTDISAPFLQAQIRSPQWTGEIAEQTVSYSIDWVSGTNSSAVTIALDTGVVTLASGNLPISGVYRVTATGTGDYEGTITADINIEVVDKTEITGTLSYTSIATTVDQADERNPQWTGEIAEQTVSYSIDWVSGDESDSVGIVSVTGVVTLTSGSTEFSGVYRVTATGTGDYDGIITADINIEVADKTLITGTLSYTGLDGVYIAPGTVEFLDPQWVGALAEQTVKNALVRIDDKGNELGPLPGIAIDLASHSGVIAIGPLFQNSSLYKVVITGTGAYTGIIESNVFTIHTLSSPK